ncbi:hypothetical protein D3C81_2236740 [compost metagenome]
MAAQVEGQADAAQADRLARAHQVVLLLAAPAVHEQHPRHAGRREQGAADFIAADVDVQAGEFGFQVSLLRRPKLSGI